MKYVLSIALIAILAGCGVSAMDGTAKPGTAKGFLGAEKDPIAIDTAKAFAGKNNVVIGSFKVGFYTYSKATQTAGGGFFSSGGAGHASAKNTLVGVDNAVFQKITDAAYADFVSTLKAKGYNVVDRSTITGTSDYKGLSTKPTPDKEDVYGSDVLFFAPNGLSVFDGGWSGAAAMGAFATIADKSGTPILDVTYTVNFANAAGAGVSVATVQVGQGISVPAGNGIYLWGGQGGTFSTNNGSIKLGQPVYSTDPFATVQDTSSDAGQAVGYAANVLSLAMGGGSSVSKDFTFTADPAKYETISKSVLSQANQKLIGAMAANR